MSETNKALIRRLLEEAVNKGNLSVVDESLSTDYVYREPGWLGPHVAELGFAAGTPVRQLVLWC
jgi:hypothetical protein